MTDPGRALDDAIEQIFAGLPGPTTPTAPTMADVEQALDALRPPYVLACPPDRHADVHALVTAAGLGHLVEVRPTDIIEGEDAVLFRRDGKPIRTGGSTP